MKIFSLILILGLATCGAKKNNSSPSFQAKTFEANDGVDLLYNIYYPKADKQKLPLFIFLHGAGERGNDNSAQLVHIAPTLTNPQNSKKYPAILLFPQCPTDGYWAPVNISEDGAWSPDGSAEATPSMQRVIELIESMMMNPSVDTDRIYISGLSMGGFGTFDLISRHPDWFAGAVAICGGGDPANVDNYKDLPLWIFHGAQDPVVSVDLSRVVANKLKAKKGKYKYTEYEEGGHDIWNTVYDNPEVLSWLFAKKKK